MGIRVITKYQSIEMTKAKPPLHVHMELMLTVECLLDYVMLQLLFKDAWCLYFLIWLKKSWKFSWMTFLFMKKTFDDCLENLDKVLQRCEEKHLVLNWEKCHFMVREGIVLGHLVSEGGIEVDLAKIEVIEHLPPPTNVKGVRSFLGHAGFYRCFIKDLSYC